MPTETEVYRNQVSEDVAVRAHIGYGRSVSIEISIGSLTVDLSLDPYDARELANALMMAAVAAEK